MPHAINRRSFLVVSGLSLAGSPILSACSDRAGAAVSLRMLTYDTIKQAKPWRAALAQYHASGGTQVRLDTLPGSGAALFPGKLRTEILGGHSPDIFRIWGGELAAPFIRAGQVENLDTVYANNGWDAVLRTRNVEYLSHAGSKYGVPINATALGIWYRKDFFARCGVDVPRSYDELEHVNEKLVRGGIQPVLGGGKYGWDVMRTFEYLLEVAAGPALHDQLLVGATSWNRPEVVDAFALLKKWGDQRWLPEGVLGIDPTQKQDMLLGGRGAMIFDNQAFEQEIADADDPSVFDTFIPPTGHNPLRFSGYTEGLMIPRATPHRDEAIALLAHLVRPDTQKELGSAYSAVRGVPIDTTKYPLSARWTQWQARHDNYLIQDQAFPPILANAYFDVQSRVLQGDQSPREAAAAMERAMGKWKGIMR
jgi:raffinose/stachyose/melibiose transport system substrate-binding protein